MTHVKKTNTNSRNPSGWPEGLLGPFAWRGKLVQTTRTLSSKCPVSIPPLLSLTPSSPSPLPRCGRPLNTQVNKSLRQFYRRHQDDVNATLTLQWTTVMALARHPRASTGNSSFSPSALTSTLFPPPHGSTFNR